MDWKYPRLQTVFLTLILLAFCVSRLLLSTGATSHYDVEKLQGITQFSVQKLRDGLHSSFTKEFFWRTVLNYWAVPILAVAGIWVAWRKGQYFAVLLTVFFSLLYFLALCLTFNDFLPFYTESELMPLSIILATPYVFCVLPQLKVENQTILLGAIFLSRLAYIHEASEKWVARKQWINNSLETMQKAHVSKAIIPINKTTKDSLQMTWGIPVESLLTSALHGEKPQRTFVVSDSSSTIPPTPTDPSLMISSFDLLKNASLNQDYFRFDTTVNYQVLKLH